MRKPVLVFGCGPAGLFSAQAAELAGCEPVIMSVKRKSEIYGAQYLHAPIPGLSDAKPDGLVKTFRLGTPERYAERVYGDETRVTSWSRVPDDPVPAWDLRKTYDRAWDKFQHRIVDLKIAPDEVDEYTAKFDTVISAVPLWSICKRSSEHKFDDVAIFVKKKMEYSGLPDWFDENNHAVVYNGTEEGYWYRTSIIFGHESTEARADQRLLEGGVWDIGFKVAGTTCDCHPNLVKAGRLGNWKPGILTHHAFESAMEALTAYDRV